MQIRRIIALTSIVPALAAALVAGCDNTIAPLAEDSENVFAIHGFLDSGLDRQEVRVSALRETVLAADPALDGVSVRSQDMTTLDTVDWSDSLATVQDGSNAHIFTASFRPASGRTYEFQIWRAGTMVAAASTTLPMQPDFQVNQPVGDSLDLSQVVSISGLDDPPLALAMQYEVSPPGEDLSTQVKIEYQQDGRTGAGAWEFDAFLKRDQQTVLFETGWPFDGPPLELKSLGAAVSVRSADWERADDPVNFLNAHGFFGSVGRFVLTWRLDSDDVGVLGFVDRQGG